MGNKRKFIFAIAVFLQVLVLVSMIVKQEVLLRNGTKIMLKCQPVDPRSLFSGDYVTLNYEISQITKIFAQKENDSQMRAMSKNDIVFVALKKNNDDVFYSFADIAKSYDVIKEDHVIVLKGRIKRIYSEKQFFENNDWHERYDIDVVYGIEDYFIPQNEGLAIERQMADVSVEVSVADDGKAALSALFIAGERVKFY